MVTDPSYLLNAASLNYVISHSDFTEFYNWMTVHKVLGRMWKEAVEPWLKILYRNFSGGTEENHEKPLSERWIFQATFELLNLRNPNYMLYRVSEVALPLKLLTILLL